MARINITSKKLTESMKEDIVRLAVEGKTQKQIQEILNCSQYAVARYSKGINPQHRHSEEQREEIIRMLVQTNMTQAQIADIVGVTKRSVSYVSTRLGLRPSRRGAKENARDRQTPIRDRDSQRYEVFLFNCKADPTLECSRMFDHIPTYWDLISICREAGMQNAEDFETEASSSVRDRLSFGVVYNRQMYQIASYSIERVKGDESDYDDFYDGMDKTFYD